MRADQLLLERGLAHSRSQAQRLIQSGVLWRAPTPSPHGSASVRASGLTDLHEAAGWSRVRKNGDELPLSAELRLQDSAELRYVSRGGLKLEGALAHTGMSVQGQHCVDVGQSTGGFTDCLLAHGAADVLGFDVGHGQLHPQLRSDARVRAVEGVNVRDAAQVLAHLRPQEPRATCLTADLSFISLSLVMPVLDQVLANQGHFLLLVKPQFELQPSDIGKGGLVKSAEAHARVQQKMLAAAKALHWQVQDFFDSAISGGDGNREFWLWATKP